MPSYSYEIGTEFDGSGKAQSFPATTVSGNATAAFDTEFAAGYLVTISGVTRVVASVTSASEMQVTQAFLTTSSTVAFTGVNMVNLGSLSTPVNAPKSAFAAYSELLELGNGTVRGAGWPTAQWRFGFLLRDQRDEIRTFCVGASDDVYIKTRENDTADEYSIFSGTMVWPVGREEKDHGKRLDLAIRFTNLVEITTA